MSRREDVRRLGLGFADQAFSSGSNFALGIVVATMTTARDFGAFAVTTSVYLFALGTARSLATDPLVIRWSGRGEAEQRATTSPVLSTSLLVSLAGSAVCVAMAMVADQPLKSTMLALALFLPGLLLQDATRYHHFATGHPVGALKNDVLWTVAQAVLLAVVIAFGVRSGPVLLAVWGAAASAAALYGFRQIGGFRPDSSACRHWLATNAQLSRRLLGEFVAVVGGANLVLLVVSVSGGLVAAGGIRGALLLLGPLNVIYLGFLAVGTPEAARARRESVSALLRLVGPISAVSFVAATVWGAIVVATPEGVGSRLLGESWPQAKSLLPYLAAYYAASGAALGAQIGLRALEAVGQSFATRVGNMLALLTGGATGAVVAGARGAAVGLMVANVVFAPLWWLAVRRALRTSPVKRRAAGLELEVAS